jgi:Zn-dependent protease with chaperone function
MEHVYPSGPAAVPANLTAATAAYQRHAWLAMLGLTAFIVLYFALSTWFAWTSWRLLSGMVRSGNFELPGFVAGVCAAFLAVFMLKALFFIQHRYQIEDLEITRDQEPRLFEFIDRLADEARAPRAHKVYLSPRVNAAVFYDLSLLNLFVPSKKNLEIGLGLVNVLSLGELKAVLAHEFGHFAQKSMAVGRWVYIAQQIAGHVVARRDALDKLLRGLSRLDIRVAWIGWVLSIIVWSIRSMMDVLFRAVLIAQRALSRQMEFQADLVAVSLTGSDALIHALHRLNAADDAWDKTLSFANDEASRKRAVNDLFAVHSRIIERMREILNQPTYGVVPPVPADAPDAHRVFKTAIAQPPRMWLTHPPSADREANAKRRYVAAPVDDRSAWTLFQDPPAMKHRMSAHVFREAQTEAVPMEKTFEQLEKEYGRAFLDRKYRGVYLGRSPVRHVRTAAELYSATPPVDVVAALDALYPQSLSHDIEELTETLEEKASLEALRDQVAQAPGGVIRHNGEELRRAELPAAIVRLERKIDTVRARLQEHDRDCRTAHLAAARRLDKGWPNYLAGLAAVLHYADHLNANIRDAQGHLSNVYAVVTADGRVSSEEMSRLVGACQQVYQPLEQVYGQAAQVVLDRTLLRRLECESWPAMLEEFKLSAPAHDNLSQWLGVVDSWINASTAALSRLRVAALEQLLLAEQQVAKFVRDGLPAADAPPAASVPGIYMTLVPGSERPRQRRLDWWDRFHAADGVLPMLARSAVAVGIVGGVVVLGAKIGTAVLTIYNPLALPVVVEVAGDRVSANPGQAVTIDVPPSGAITVRALSPGNEVIETFEETLDGTNVHYVYNVAGGVPLLEWTAVYSESGNSPPSGERQIGAARWMTTAADHLFEEPPRQIEVSRGGVGTRRVLTASTYSPGQLVELVPDAQERDRMVSTHVRWDDTRSAQYLEWLSVAAARPDFDGLLKARLDAQRNDVVLRRFQQDYTQGDEHAAVCAEAIAASQAEPANADLQYLAIRCDADKRAQKDRFVAAHAKWPDNAWLRFASGASLADAGEYGEALTQLENSRLHLPALQDYVTLEVARLRRLSRPADADLSDLTSGSRRLAIYLAIEDGTQVANTPLAPYAALARGDVVAAYGNSAQAGEGRPRLLRLIAGSDGATPAMIREALAAPIEENPDAESLFVMYGVAAREHRDVAPYLAPLSKDGSGPARSVLSFLDKIHHGVDPQRAVADLELIELTARLTALDTAVLMLGDAAPGAWRAEVRRGLFVGERPYMAARVAEDAPASRAPESVATPPARGDGHPARILSPST